MPGKIVLLLSDIAKMFAMVSLLTYLLGRSAIKHFRNGEARREIIRRLSFCRGMLTPLRLVFRRGMRAVYDEWYCASALTAFALKDYPCFLKNISQLKGDAMQETKAIWLTLYDITVCHNKQAALSYPIEILESARYSVDKCHVLLQSVICYEKGEFEKAGAKYIVDTVNELRELLLG